MKRPLLVIALILSFSAIPALAGTLSVSTPASDIAIAPGTSVDIPLTFHNDGLASASGVFVMDVVINQTGYHYQQLSHPACGDVVDNDGGPWSDYWHFAVPSIPGGGDVVCSLRITRDVDAIQPLYPVFYLAADSEIDYLYLRLGTLSDVGVAATLVERTVEVDAIHTVVDLTVHNAGNVGVIPLTHTNSCDPGMYEVVLAGDCTIEPQVACPVFDLPSGIYLHWPTTSAAGSHTCRVRIRTPLANFDQQEYVEVTDLGDPTNGGRVLNTHTDPYAELPTNFLADGIDLDQYGLSGSWANPATPAQGFVINVQPDFYGAGKALLFGGWFTYDAVAGVGPRWYTVQATIEGKVSDVPIYRTVGGRFDAPDATLTESVGSAMLGFNDCNHGVLRYTFGDGRSGAIPLSRLQPNISCHGPGDPPIGIDSPLSGAWFDPSTSGQGIVMDGDRIRGIAFAGWFTFGPIAGATGAIGQRWYTLQGNAPANVADLVIYASQGGAFDASAPATTTAVGTARMTLLSCMSARLDFTFSGGENAPRQGTLNLARVGDPPPLCALQ